MQRKKLITTLYLVALGVLLFGLIFRSYAGPNSPARTVTIYAPALDVENAPHILSPADSKLKISPKTIPGGKYGSLYQDQHLKVTGGKGAYSFSFSGGNPPPGISLSGDGILSGTPTSAGSYRFTVTAVGTSGHSNDQGSQNYTLAVDPVPLAVTANAQTKEFGTPDPALTYSSSGFVNNDGTGVFTGQLSRTPGEAVGRYIITKGDLNAGRNYTISFTGNTFTIAAASPASKLKIDPASIPNGQYGSAFKTLILKVTGGNGTYSFSVTKGSLPAGITLSGDGTLSGTATAAGTYPFTVTATGQFDSVSQNYTLTIDRASLTIAAANATITYGSAIPTLTVSYSGFVNGDNASSFSTPPAITTTATSSSPVGTYPISVSGAVDSNYKIIYSSGTLTINPAPLAVTANPQKKEVGAADPPLTYTASGFVNGDNNTVFTGSLSRTPGETVGTYPITKGSLSAGHNYTINFTGNYLTISSSSPPPTQPPGDQHITWTQNLLVGCNTSTTLHLTATASSGLPVTYSVADTNIAVVSGNILTLLRPGSTVITANQSGDATHNAAQPVADTLLYQSASLIRQHWNDVIIFDNSSGSFVQWQWYKNGDAIPDATGPFYSETPSLNGQYYVIATNASGQHIQTCTLAIKPDTTVSTGIRAHPNPVNAGAAVTLTSNYTALALQGATLQVIDLTGKVWQQVTSAQPSMQITMPSQQGIYIIRLLLTNGQMSSVNVLVLN